MNITIHNATGSGCDVRIETHIPGVLMTNSTVHIAGRPALATMAELGDLYESHLLLNTTFGQKDVNRYTRYVEGTAWHYYCGTDPLVQYRIVYVEFGIEMTFTIQNTSVDDVRTGNNWTG